MPKPVPLSPDVMEAAVTPRTTPPPAAPATAPSEKKAAAARKEPQIPLQLRLPRPEVRAIKISAAEREQTVSDFMLACYHAYKQAGGHA